MTDTKLTPEQIEDIRGRLSFYRGSIATWGGLRTEMAQEAAIDIAALLAHAAALEAENEVMLTHITAQDAKNALWLKEWAAERFAGYDVCNLACYSDDPGEYTISRDLLDHFKRVLDGTAVNE